MKNKVNRIVSFIILLSLAFNMSMTTTVYASIPGWERQGTPKFTNYTVAPNMINKTDVSGSTIMSRLRSSYTYNTRRNRIKNLNWVQTLSYEPYFDNTVYGRFWARYTDSIDTPTGESGYTAWYDSPHGLILDYLSPFSNVSAVQGGMNAPSTDQVSNDVIKDMIDYNKVQYGKTDSAFIATNGGMLLSDAKSASTLMRDNSSMNYPIYLNNNMDIDNNVVEALNEKGVKNIYIMGGYARFNFTAGITKNFNIVRVGGINSQETYDFYENIPSNIKKPQHYEADSNGIVIQGTLPNNISRSFVNNQLIKFRDSQNLNDLADIASYVSNSANIGNKPTSSSQPIVILGVNYKGFESYWICYYSTTGGTYVYQIVLDDYDYVENANVTVEYRDKATNTLISPKSSEKVTVGTSKSYSAKTIANYTYNSSKLISGGTETTSSNPVNFTTKEGTNTVIFYYNKNTTQTGTPGTITFTPYEAAWTNQGKTSEGSGTYPVKVDYSGDTEIISEGKVVITHNEPQSTTIDGITTVEPNLIYDYEVPFEVTHKLSSIKVSGSASSTITGSSGTVNLTSEGKELNLKGEGVWGNAQYTLPSVGSYETITSTTIPSAPTVPTGTSGKYNLDWTKTTITGTEAKKEWINSVPYSVSVKVTDNLSGIGYDEKITVTDSSQYNNNGEHLIKSSLSESVTVKLTDGIYKLNVKANDVAGNTNSKEFSTYYIDSIDPMVDFNVKNKIFSSDNGAIEKASLLGSGTSYYGNITTSDNLSGVKSISYKWTYGNSVPTSEYTSLYEASETYTDRSSEIITKEVEKPVGDNLYLHVKVYDVAGNYTTAIYGPYEDPIKLKGLEVTDIRDPRWTNVFWNDTEYKNYNGKSFKVDEMAIDTHPTLKNAIPKKGYAFYFDIASEYLYREQDRVEVGVNFYYVKNNIKTRVDVYYNDNNNPLTLVGGGNDNSNISLNTSRYGDVLIGNHNKLILTKGVRVTKGSEWKTINGVTGWKDSLQYTNGKEQWWYGRYYIPSSSFFVPIGEEPRPENILEGGNVLINFEIVAYKNGLETLSTDRIFNYNTEQWINEAGTIKSPYSVGDVILFNGKYGVTSDSSTRTIH